MSSIFNGNYTRLDDDTSFQLVRTNPLLTTNTKLMYDGENMYLESYDANPLLVTQKYKNVKVSGSSPFNRDIRNFLLGTHESAYDIGQKESDYSICDSYDKQFETMYWCGAESIKSEQYPQEFGFIAPLYIRKKLPNYFVIFRVDGPSNHNLKKDSDGNPIDNVFDIDEDVMKKARILKSFDLREGTPIGNYLKRYVEQTGFVYDRSVHVNFSSSEITYYGIDKKYGVLTTKKENFRTELLENDNTVMHSDDWITNGFRRNNLIFPYIINLEFLFDDNDTDDYKFSRYFGLYCNDIDLFDFEAKYRGGGVIVDRPEEVTGEKIVKRGKYRNIGLIMSSDDYDDGCSFDRNDRNTFHYVKDKNGCLHHVIDIYTNPSANSTKIIEIPDRALDLESVCGFEKKTVSAYCERIDHTVRSEFSFKINKRLRQGDSITFTIDGVPYETFTAVTEDETAFEESESIQIPAGCFLGNNFSGKGTVEDTARAFCGAVNSIDDSDYFFEAMCNGDIVVVRCVYADGNDTVNLDVVPDSSLILNRRITVTSGSGHMEGGSGNRRNCFKINTGDLAVFGRGRYLKSGDPSMKNAEIKSCVQYVNKYDEIERGFNVVVTDDNGTNVRVSNTCMVEIVDRFYPKFGVLGFFPVRDFDFDTVYSIYGDDTAFVNECAEMERVSSRVETDDGYTRGDIRKLSTGRFKDNEWRRIESEYEYFMENLIPSMSVESKSVPYISKWGFYDEQKDSCENPYRLNMSKIFGTSNLSANTFTYLYSVNEFTHSMPYYMTKNGALCNMSEYGNYQYVLDTVGILNFNSPDDSDGTEYDKFVAHCVEKFTDTETDFFEKLFCSKNDTNKRFTRKYSRFDFGDSDNFPSTLFRGVKFNIKKIVGGEDTKCQDYNGYRFAFVYIPKELGMFYVSNKVHFVKNDTFRFVVGFVVVNTLTKNDGNIIRYYAETDFCKSYMYAGCYGLLKLPTPLSVYYTQNCTVNSDSEIEVTLQIDNLPIEDLFDVKRNMYGEIDISMAGVSNQTVRRMLDNIDDRNSITEIRIHNLDNTFVAEYTDVVNDDGMIIIDGTLNPTTVYTGGNDIFADIRITDTVDVDSDGNIVGTVAMRGFYNVFESMSAYNIKQNINDDFVVHRTVSKKNVSYHSTNGDVYEINIEDPVSFNTYDIFKSTPKVVPESGVFVPCCSEVTLKDNPNEVSLKTINRYSGYYNPVFNDTLMYDDYVYSGGNSPVVMKFSNTRMDTDYADAYGGFGKIRNMWFHKVNEEKPDKIITMTDPLYPAINQFALDFRDFNIFESNWDEGYFTKQLDIDKYERLPGTVSTLNKPSMFGSKCMNIPDEITIDTFSGCREWDDSLITNAYGTDGDVMYKEINGNSVKFYLFLHKRIVSYFEKESGFPSMFRDYVNPEHSFGDKTTIDDDIRSYIEKNIIGLYRIESVRLWVKGTKVGTHDNLIDNDYVSYVGMNDVLKKRKNMKKTNAFNVTKMANDMFDRCVTYNLKSGFMECFGFSVTIKRI